MPCLLTVEVTDGGPVVVKRATGADAARLRAAGERLVGAAHPGVVQVIDSQGSGTTWELRLVHAGRPADAVGPLRPAQVAALVAGAAATLADLHDAGIVHGRLIPSHLLIGPHGRPVLCGFGDAANGAEPVDDVAALGSIIVALLGAGAGADAAPLPERRWARRGSSGAWARRTLLLLADHACAEPPTRRPSARRFAASIAEAFPAAASEPPYPPEHDLPVPDRDPLDALRASADTVHRRPVPLLALACAAAGALLLGAAIVRVAQPDATTRAARSSAPPLPTDRLPTDRLPTTTVTSPAAAIIDGTTVRLGTRRYQVGDPGDLVVVGDWDCNGSSTPAVLRPSTGEVFVFTAWASDREVVVPPVASIDDAVNLMVGEEAGGCSALAAERGDGSRVEIPEAARA